jgi:hypothetical protein
MGKSVLLDTEGKDETNLLADDYCAPYLFDNIYFPHNAPVRQGKDSPQAVSTSSTTVTSNNSSGNDGNTFNFGSGLPGGGSIGDFLDFNIR